MVGWNSAADHRQCPSTHLAKRQNADSTVDIIVNGGLSLQVTKHEADRSQLLRSGFELEAVEPLVCPIEVNAFEAWRDMVDEHALDVRNAVDLLKVADFLIDKPTVDRLCLHLARELFKDSPIMSGPAEPDVVVRSPSHLHLYCSPPTTSSSCIFPKLSQSLLDKVSYTFPPEHPFQQLIQLAPCTTTQCAVALQYTSSSDHSLHTDMQDIITAIPEHLLISIIACAHSLEAVFSTLPDPYHLLALCSFYAAMSTHAALDISSETLEATRCALAAAQGRLCHLDSLTTQVFPHPSAGWGALHHFLKPQTALATLEVSSHDPSNAHFQLFCSSIPTTLCRLRLSGAPLFNPALVAPLQSALTLLPGLCDLALTHGSLTPDSARCLAACMYASLRHCLLPALSSVSFSHNEIGQQGWESLAPALAALPALRHLNLEAASRTASLRPMVTRECPLIAFSALRNLDISSTFEDDPAWDGVADPYGTVGSIQWLPKHSWLSGLRQLRAAGICRGRFLHFILARLATAAEDMQRVVISGSKVSPAVLVALGQGLARWADLASVELRSCGLTRDSVRAIAPQLARLVWLQTMDVSDNPLGAAGATALLSELADSHPATIQTLRLNGTACGSDDGCTALAYQLSRGATRGLRCLRQLSVCSNGIGPQGAAALAQPLAALPELERLDLSGNFIGDRGVAAVLQELEKTGAVQEVVVRESGVEAAALQGLQARLPARLTLVWT